MSMAPYLVMCYASGCVNPAAFKIAARWSDGLTHELKTYALACASCLPGLLASALTRRAACRLAAGETLDVPGVYELHRGKSDQSLTRRRDLETSSR